MAFLDDLKKNAKTLADQATEKGKDLVDKGKDTLEISKLNAQIGDETKKITEFKVALGEIVWNKFAAGELTNEDAKAICDKIVECNEVIKGIEAQIEAIKNKVAE